MFRKGCWLILWKVSLHLINMHRCCYGDLWVCVYVFKLTSVRTCQQTESRRENNDVLSSLRCRGRHWNT